MKNSNIFFFCIIYCSSAETENWRTTATRQRPIITIALLRMLITRLFVYNWFLVIYYSADPAAGVIVAINNRDNGTCIYVRMFRYRHDKSWISVCLRANSDYVYIYTKYCVPGICIIGWREIDTHDLYGINGKWE